MDFILHIIWQERIDHFPDEASSVFIWEMDKQYIFHIFEEMFIVYNLLNMCMSPFSCPVYSIILIAINLVINVGGLCDEQFDLEKIWVGWRVVYVS